MYDWFPTVEQYAKKVKTEHADPVRQLVLGTGTGTDTDTCVDAS